MNKYLILFLLMISANGFCAVNKWVDSDGNVHYSDQPPPPETKAKVLRSKSSVDDSEGASDLATANAPAAPKTFAEKEAELKKAQKAKQEAADKAAKEQAKADANKAACATAQQSLRTLQEGIRMVEVGANGERSYMDDTQRQQRIDRVQQDISTYCK